MNNIDKKIEEKVIWVEFCPNCKAQDSRNCEDGTCRECWEDLPSDNEHKFVHISALQKQRDEIEEDLAFALTHSEQGSYEKNLEYVKKELSALNELE